jgi:hypothetical protein
MKALLVALGASAVGLVLGEACGGSILLGTNDGKESREGGAANAVDREAGQTPEAGEMAGASDTGDETGEPALPETSTGIGVDGDVYTDGLALASDGACGDTQFDPRNCGTCGHDCMGGACEGGTCVPLPPGVLASGQVSPSSIVVDDTYVYWINEGTGPVPQQAPPSGPAGFGVTPIGLHVMKCAKTGCNNNPTILFPPQNVPASPFDTSGGKASGLRGFTVDGTNVYWEDSQGLMECALEGCNQRMYLVNPSGASTVISVTASNAYTCAAGLSVGDGCLAIGLVGAPSARTALWSGSLADAHFGNPLGIAVDATNAYSVDEGGTAVFCPLPGCAAPTLLAQSHDLGRTLFFGIDATSVYWNRAESQGSTGRVLRCEKRGCGGSPAVLASGLSNPLGLTSDGTNVYFAEFGTSLVNNAIDGRIAKCAVTGCPNGPTPIAEHLGYPHGVAVDASRVYWTDFGSATVVYQGSPWQSADGRIMVALK